MELMNYYIPEKIKIWVSDIGEPKNCDMECKFLNYDLSCKKFHTKLKHNKRQFGVAAICDECLAQIELHKPYQKLLEP